MIPTPKQIRRARHSLEWSVNNLADFLGIAERTVRCFEYDTRQKRHKPMPGELWGLLEAKVKENASKAIGAILIVFLLSGCATIQFGTQNVPQTMQAVYDSVNSRLRYRDYHAYDFRYLPNGGTGNCATYAYNYEMDLHAAGIPAKMEMCHLGDGRMHAITVAIDPATGKVWAFDQRQYGVIPADEEDCK